MAKPMFLLLVTKSEYESQNEDWQVEILNIWGGYIGYIGHRCIICLIFCVWNILSYKNDCLDTSLFLP